MIFYIIYFFYCCGCENLIVEEDGFQYVIQAVDKMDKNHGIQDTDDTNRGKMYATNCKYWLVKT